MNIRASGKVCYVRESLYVSSKTKQVRGVFQVLKASTAFEHPFQTSL